MEQTGNLTYISQPIYRKLETLPKNPKREHENYPFDEDNNAINFSINEIYDGESFIFKYLVKAKKPGLYKTSTIIKILNENNKYTFFNIPLNIRISPQPFKVTASLLDLQEETGKPLDITYIIEYLNKNETSFYPYKINASIGEICRDPNVLVDRNSSNEWSNLPIRLDNLALDPNYHVAKEKIRIKYSDSGLHAIPEISFYNQTYYFAERVDIKKLGNRYILEISLLLTIIALLLGPNLVPIWNYILRLLGQIWNFIFTNPYPKIRAYNFILVILFIFFIAKLSIIIVGFVWECIKHIFL